jgi:hypothetical protein
MTSTILSAPEYRSSEITREQPSEVHRRAPLGHLDVAAAGQRLVHHEQVHRPVADVLVVDPLGLAGARRDRRPGVADELLARLVEADHRAVGVVGALVDLQHVLHLADELRVGLRRDAPLPLQVRLQLVF